jgi:hypothetical protein
MTAHAQAYAFSTPAGLAGSAGTADGTNGTVRFHGPGGVGVDSGGNVYVADTSNHTIRKVTPLGNSWVVTTIAGSAGATGTNDGANSTARFYSPHGIAVDSQTNLYVADTYNHAIRKITPVGTNWVVSTLAGTAGSHGTNDGPGSTASFYSPFGVAVDSVGNVVVADTDNHTIRLLVPMGTSCIVSTLAGLPLTIGIANGSNSVARFNYPSGVAVGAGTNVFVADTDNSMIRQIIPVGTDWVVTTLAGSAGSYGSNDGTNNNALFSFAYGLAVDGATNLYVADAFDNDTIRKITPIGTNWVVSTIGGSAGVSGSADGLGAAALFHQPESVAVDSGGNLYVADTFNHTVRLGRFGFLLQAALLGGKVVVSWPAAASNYVLETKGTVTSATTWTLVTTGVVLSGNSFYKTNSASVAPAFFRLHK